jgi:hypothetical protein
LAISWAACPLETFGSLLFLLTFRHEFNPPARFESVARSPISWGRFFFLEVGAHGPLNGRRRGKITHAKIFPRHLAHV